MNRNGKRIRKKERTKWIRETKDGSEKENQTRRKERNEMKKDRNKSLN